MLLSIKAKALFHYLIVTMVLGWAWPGMAAGPRVAIVADTRQAAIDSLIDMAVVKASANPDLVVLERPQINKILREHEQALAGRMDAAKAIRAGGILNADLMAVVQTDVSAKTGIGLVIYDARTGVRFLDEPLPEKLEGGAEAISQAIMAAIAKQNLGLDERKTLCVQSFRNAELPRSMDQFCEGMCLLVERALLQSDRVALLDRTLLKHVNEERAVAPAARTNDLLSSAILVQTDIGLIPGTNGFRATILLTQQSGSTLGKAVVTNISTDGGALAAAVAGQIQRELKTAIPTNMDNKAACQAEARRFLKEAEVCESNDEKVNAWRAVEAAYALDPENRDAQLFLMNTLFKQGNMMMGILYEKGTIRYGSKRMSPETILSDDKIGLVLDYGQRGYDLWHGGLESVLGMGTSNRKVMETYHKLSTMRDYARYIAKEVQANPNPAIRRRFQDLARRHLDLEWSQIQQWQILSVQDPTNGFGRFTVQLCLGSMALPYWSATPYDLFGWIEQYLDSWLEIGRQCPVGKDDDERSMLFIKNIEYSITEFFNMYGDKGKAEFEPCLQNLAGKMLDHPNPEINKAGKYLKSGIPAIMVPGKKETLATSINWNEKGIGLTAISGRVCTTNGFFFRELQARIDTAGSPDERMKSFVAAIELMLAKKYIYQMIVLSFVKTVQEGHLGNAAYGALLDRLLAACDQPDVEISDSGYVWHKKEMLTRLLRDSRPAVAGEVSGMTAWAEPPWQTPICLWTNKTTIIHYLVTDEMVYAFCRNWKLAPRSQLDIEKKVFTNLNDVTFDFVAIPMQGGNPRLVQHFQFPSYMGWHRDCPIALKTAQIAAQNAYVLISGESRGFGGKDEEGNGNVLLEISLDGRDYRHLEQSFDLPAKPIQTFALYDGKLYLAVPGYLVRATPGKRETEIILSSRRSTGNKLEQQGFFGIRSILPDPDRHRLLLFLQSRGLQEWSLDLVKGECRDVSFHIHPGKWIDPVFQEHFVVSASVDDIRDYRLWGSTRLIESINLATDQATTLFDKLARNNDDWLSGPYFVCGQYVWSAGAFGRMRLADGHCERFKPVSQTTFKRKETAGCFTPTADGRKIIYGTEHELWLLPLKDNETLGTINDRPDKIVR